MLDLLVVDESDARAVVEAICVRFDVPVPRLRFHARRSRFTGATERPRFLWVSELGEAEVVRRETTGWGALPPHGAIRLGRSSTLMTIAHETAHHLVFHLDPPSTAHHGNRWVGRFDDSAGVIADMLDS